MNTLVRLSLLFAIFALGACAATPVAPIAMSADAYEPGSSRIAVSVGEVPETDTTFPGAGCLLCVGVANAAHSDLTTHVQGLKPDGLDNFGIHLAKALESNGAVAKNMATAIDIDALDNFTGEGSGEITPVKDFRPLQKSLDADKLLILEFTGHGVSRTYSAYVPTDVPKAYVKGLGFMVDLRTNRYLWYRPFSVYQTSEGVWNEPPTFPGLTNAYYQAIERTKDLVHTSMTADAATLVPGTKGHNPVSRSSAAKTAKFQ